MDFLGYPVFNVVEGRGIIPHVPLPEDFMALVPKFYEEGRREIVERFVEDIKKSLREGASFGSAKIPRDIDIRLGWDDERGLEHIAIGGQAGLDLNDSGGLPSFQEHNMSTGNGIPAGYIAMKYVSELLKSR